MNPQPFSLSGTIAPTPVSAAYRAGLVVVAAAMLLLPIVYVSLIAMTATAVWWHLTANLWMLRGVSHWRLLAYAAPAVSGVVLVFFMVKPILARPAKQQEPVPILPAAEPGLFAFIEQICRQVRAPAPSRVQVDCQVNASARFLPGRLSLLRGDLVLTIGLPLAAGLSVRELGGVLAHEFGHFAQGGGMRLTMVVRSVNMWFARVVYERDKWDQQLAEWLQESSGGASIIVAMATGAVWVSRRILAGLMMAGHAISCFMTRQMEYDADSYEIKFAGSDAFIRTMIRLREINLAAEAGYNDLGEGLRVRAVPANLPALMLHRLGGLSAETLAQVREPSSARTGFLDTHPSDADRVRVAEMAVAAGVLVGGDGPATQLFQDFEALGAAATRHHYEHDLGLPMHGLMLVDIDEAIEGSTARHTRQQAVKELFADRLSPLRPISLPLDEIEPLGTAELLTEIRRAREAMMAVDGKLAETYRRVDWLELRRDRAFSAEEVLSTGMRIGSAAEFDLAEGTAQDAKDTQTWAVEQLAEQRSDLDRFEEAAARRMACSVCLAGAIGRADDSVSLARAFNAVAAVMPHARDLRRLVIALAYLERYQMTCGDPVARGRIDATGARIRDCWPKLRGGLSGTPCPPGLDTTQTDMAAWCGLTPQPDPARASEVLDRVFLLYFELLARVAKVVIEAEAGVTVGTRG